MPARMIGEVARGLQQSADPVVGAGAEAVGPVPAGQPRWPAGRRPTAVTARPGRSTAAPYVPPDDKPRRPDGPVVPYAELHVPLELQLPRRRLLAGGPGRGGGPARAARAGADRSRRVLRRGPVRRDRRGVRRCRRCSARSCRSDLTGPQNGVADPEGSHLLVLAEGQEGYHRLAGAITEAQLAGGEKGRPVYDLEDLAARGRDHWLILTGCRKGLVRQALRARSVTADGPAAAARELDRLIALFGKDRVVVELIDHRLPTDSTDNDVLADLAADAGLPMVATNNVHYAHPGAAQAGRRDGRGPGPAGPGRDGRLAAAGRDGVPAVGGRRWRPGSAGTTARSRGRCELADQLAFDLRAGETEAAEAGRAGRAHPDVLAAAPDPGGRRRSGTAPARSGRTRTSGSSASWPSSTRRDFPGYFLIVARHRRVRPTQGILCQGRGSAANSAVCYALGITAVDSILYDLPFERFLASTRDRGAGHRRRLRLRPPRGGDPVRLRQVRPPQRRPGRQRDHLPAEVRGPGHGQGARLLGRAAGRLVEAGRRAGAPEITSTDHDIPAPVVAMAEELLKFPRHLGIHSGGMVLTERPVGEVVPIEHARMENRTVLQWDKDDCAWMGLVKFDLLGLGHARRAAVRDRHWSARRLGESWELHTIPKEEPGVYDQLCRADSVGVFQVESRAQMATLPRLRPRQLLRPGHRDRADPARPDPGRRGASVHPPQDRGGAGHLPAPDAASRCWSGPWACRCSRSS